VAPTTFDAEVTLPFVSFRFDGTRASSVATFYCEDVVWSYRKLPDLISRQKVTCDVEIIDSTESNTRLLSSRHRKSLSDRILSDLSYTSTTRPNGDNVRALHLTDACVNVVYSSWRDFASFFSGLPEPTFLSPKEGKQAAMIALLARSLIDTSSPSGVGSASEVALARPSDSHLTPYVSLLFSNPGGRAVVSDRH
jgi:hypothetical protein